MSKNDRNSAALIARMMHGDQNALEQLLFESYGFLLEHVDRALPDWARDQISAEDVLQETHVRAFRSIRQFHGTSVHTFRSWLTAIADHQLSNFLRDASRKKRGGDVRRVRYDRVLPDESVSDLVTHLSDDCHTPSQQTVATETIHAVRVGLARLPADQQRVIELLFLSGKSLPEAAESMQRSPAAVRGLAYRAKCQLKDIMGRSSR